MMKIPVIVKNFQQVFVIILAGLVYGAALQYFIIPAKVILTGFEGITLSIAYFLDDRRLFIMLYAAFQSVLIVFALFKIGRLFALHTCVMISTVIGALFFFPELMIARPEPENERLVLVIFGGLLIGAAKAVAFKNKGSAGDEDIISAYFAIKWLRPVGSIAIYAGTISTLFGLLLVFLKTGQLVSVLNTLIYTALYIFVSTVSLDSLFKKYRLTKLIIIGDDEDAVVHAIRGFSDQKSYTIEGGTGGYSKQKKSIISIILSHEDVASVTRRIKASAPGSFLYYHDIEGVCGHVDINPIGK